MRVEGQKYAISSGCFLSMNPREGVNYIRGAVGNPYIPEVNRVLDAAQTLGTGVEIVYRNRGVWPVICQMIENNSVLVPQVHGPIFDSLQDAFLSGLQELGKKGPVMNTAVSALALGTLQSDFENTRLMADRLGARSIVVHPRGAQIMHERLGILENVNLAIEPDYRRHAGDSAWVYEPEEVYQIAKETKQGVCLDVSHFIISGNTPEQLLEAYRILSDTPKGVLSLHFAATIPMPNKTTSEIFAAGAASLPLDPRILGQSLVDRDREVIGAIREDERFHGSVVIEIYNFRSYPDTYDGRLKAIEVTLNLLEGGRVDNSSYSFPDEPTHRPI